MPKITGTLTDFGFSPMPGMNPRLYFQHNTPGVSGAAIMSTKRIEVIPAKNGLWEADLVASARIAPAGFYTITLEWSEPPSRKRIRERCPGRLYVPAEGGILADILRVPANPGLVWVGTEPPGNPSPGTWWLNDDGILQERNDKGGWTFKQNTRGPAGYNAIGALPTLQALADYTNQTAGPNAFSDAMRNRQPFIRAEDYASFQAALDAGAAARKDVVFSSTFTLTKGVIWQANMHSIRGEGDARLDCRNMTAGPAITVIGLGGRSYLDWEFLSATHHASGFQLRGPEDDTTVIDGIFIDSQDSKVSHLNFDNLYIKGFRDGVIFGANNWCVAFNQTILNFQRRRGLSFLSPFNAGENYNFHGCTIAGTQNAAGTGAGIYMDDGAQFLAVNMFGCSLDYCDYLADVNAGTLSLNGCHLEDSTDTAMIRLSYTGGKARTSLAVTGSVFDPAEPRPGRSHLIEVKAGSGPAVHTTLTGNSYRVYDRPVQVFRSLAATHIPFLSHTGGMFDNNAGTNIASFGQFSNLLVDGEMTRAEFVESQLQEGAWWRQGTVEYTFTAARGREGKTKNIMRMVGPAGNVVGSNFAQTVRVYAGQHLVPSVYLNTQGLTGGEVQFRLAFRDQAGKAIQENVIEIVKAADGWRGYGKQFTAPPGVMFADFKILNVNMRGTVLVDDPVLTAI